MLFSSSRSLLNISCIFSILFPRFWIIFTIIILNSFSGRLPISSSFVWSGGFLRYSFICCVFLCLLVLLNLLCLGSPFCRLHVCSSHFFGTCSQWVRLVQWVVQASWWRGLVPVFWWMRLDLVFLVGRTTSDGVFWDICELSMILGSHSANGLGCIPLLLIVWHRVFSTVACWLLRLAGS